MPPQGNLLGLLKPIGGGDPIPLNKAELVVGRRASCDIRLDFGNISGKHCMLRLHNQVWHVKDMGSTNGTTVNGAPLSSEHSVMPEDEIGIGGHLFTIDYEPGAPTAIVSKGHILEDEVQEARKRHSLMELAGLDTDDDRPAPRRRPTKPPETIERLSADEADFDDALPETFKAAPTKKAAEPDDDDFLKLIQDEVIKPEE
jgi:pSer/pThr/pTyr-binding forkhead associated (FHA) protein